MPFSAALRLCGETILPLPQVFLKKSLSPSFRAFAVKKSCRWLKASTPNF
jgi:hypothetical protein